MQRRLRRDGCHIVEADRLVQPEDVLRAGAPAVEVDDGRCRLLRRRACGQHRPAGVRVGQHVRVFTKRVHVALLMSLIKTRRRTSRMSEKSMSTNNTNGHELKKSKVSNP